MKILVTGAKGFVGRNLCSTLWNIKDKKDKTYNLEIDNIFEYDIDTSPEKLEEYSKECDFVFHLAGVNRPKEEKDFMEGNFGFTSKLLNSLKRFNNKAPIAMTSSIQASLDNPYGKSKKAGEDLIFEYGKVNNVKTYVYRLPNVFGKWCKPNYNSVIATFCYNIAHNIDITINDRTTVLNLVYIDDVVSELLKALTGQENRNGAYCSIPTVHTITLGEIADQIYSFKETRDNLSIPDMSNPFTKKLTTPFMEMECRPLLIVSIANSNL